MDERCQRVLKAAETSMAYELWVNQNERYDAFLHADLQMARQFAAEALTQEDLDYCRQALERTEP
jgi:hypothetical protein